MKEFHYSAEEAGMETLARAVIYNDVICVLQVVKDEEGSYFYGVFASQYKSGILDDRNVFLKFLDDNRSNGYSVGAFDSLEEVNEDMKYNNCTAYGFFEGGFEE